MNIKHKLNSIKPKTYVLNLENYCKNQLKNKISDSYDGNYK